MYTGLPDSISFLVGKNNIFKYEELYECVNIWNYAKTFIFVLEIVNYQLTDETRTAYAA